jgi:hypothetical protein
MAEIKIISRNHKDLKYIPVSGASGGVSPYGAVLVAFFHDHMDVPDEAIIDVQGNVASERPGMMPSQVIRDYLVGMQMTREQAWSIGTWLQQKAKEAGYDPATAGTPPPPAHKWN